MDKTTRFLLPFQILTVAALVLDCGGIAVRGIPVSLAPLGLLCLMLLARAEAARWRGDTKAARKWDDRAKRLLAPIKTFPQAILADLGGL